MTDEIIAEQREPVNVTALLNEAKKRGIIAMMDEPAIDFAAEPNPYDPPVP